jgi:hypothetical protein
MSSKHGRVSRCGPDYRPVCREDKVAEWAQAIRVALRHCDGALVAEAVAAEFAGRFWEALADKQVPVKEIMETPGGLAAKWTLGEARGELVVAADTVIKKPEEAT